MKINARDAGTGFETKKQHAKKAKVTRTLSMASTLSETFRKMEGDHEHNHDSRYDIGFNLDELEDGGEFSVVDLTNRFNQPSGVSKLFRQRAECFLAMYTVTMVVNAFGKIVRSSRSISGDPSIASIPTSYRIVTSVYSDICASLEIPSGKGKTCEAMLQGIVTDDGYKVSLAGPTRQVVNLVEKIFNQTMEQHNFYQGKTLRYGSEDVQFIPVPTTNLEDVVLPASTVEEYQLNVVDFLTNTNMQAVTRKRGILLYGPPGTGKTSGVKALFKKLNGFGVTSVYLSDETFSHMGIEEVFAFINKYLAPALVVFEDIDLIAPDRNNGASRLIGPLLSALNGIEDQQKPIVVLATTNRIEVLDAAVTRPCRFDRRINIDFPSEQDMHSIFRKVAGFDAPEGCFKNSSELKMTGAHVEEIYRTASLLAEKRSKPTVECVSDAINTVKKHFMIVSPKPCGFSEDKG